MSISEIKKIIQGLNLKLGINIGSLQVLLRSLSEQSFNTTISLADKLRMLIIHIRSPCKLFYQVSLNFNIKDSSSEEIEVDQLDFKKLKSMKNELETQEISQKVLRNRYFSASPDTQSYFQQDKSPKTLFALTGKQPNDVKNNNNGKTLKENSKIAQTKKKKTTKNSEIQKTLEKFKQTHKSIMSADKTSNQSKKIQMHRDYVANMRKKMFSDCLVKKAIFNAWKIVFYKKKHEFTEM